MRKSVNASFWGFLNTCVSECRKISRRRRNIVDSAFESWWFIFLSSEKILVIRTHTQELHVVKCAPNTQISAHFGPHWGQHNYVDKVLPKVTGVFLWLSKTKSMTFWCSKNVSNILVGWLIHSILWGQPKKNSIKNPKSKFWSFNSKFF